LDNVSTSGQNFAMELRPFWRAKQSRTGEP
jgi:hypothetical protein